MCFDFLAPQGAAILGRSPRRSLTLAQPVLSLSQDSARTGTMGYTQPCRCFNANCASALACAGVAFNAGM